MGPYGPTWAHMGPNTDPCAIFLHMDSDLPPKDTCCQMAHNFWNTRIIDTEKRHIGHDERYARQDNRHTKAITWTH